MGNYEIILELILGLIIFYLFVRTKVLTIWGSFAAVVMALLFYEAGGLAWLSGSIVFLILSSLWTKWPGGASGNNRRRNLNQVLANGGIAIIGAIVSLVYNEHYGLILMAGSLAAAAADTWATEWGRKFGGKPLSLRSFIFCQAGESGAVSIAGFVAAFSGALSIAGTLWLVKLLNSREVLFISLAGWSGAFFDSIGGAWLQAFWKSESGKIFEEKSQAGKNPERIRGISWVNNDIVNVLATVSGGIIALLILGAGE